MRFLHISDLHLDAPHPTAEGNMAEHLGMRATDALASVVLYAKQNGIRLVLISGDLFDCAYLTRETEKFLVSTFASAPECHFVIAPGNRDYYTDGSAYAYLPFSDNVHIFSSATPTCFPIDELSVQVWGFAHVSPDMHGARVLSSLTLAPKAEGVWRIFCGHCAMETEGAVLGEDSFVESGEIPTVTREQLAGCGFDFAALGYAHASDGIRRIGYTGGCTYYGYAGALIGRGFDECGMRGAISGDITRDGTGMTAVSIRRLRIARHHCERLEVFFEDGILHREDVFEAISLAVTAAEESGVCFDRDSHVLVTLSGTLPATVYIDEDYLRRFLPLAASIRVQDETDVSDDAALSCATTLRGAYYRALSASRHADDGDLRAVADRALIIGLDALTEHTRGE